MKRLPRKAVYTHEEVLDHYIGKKGKPERDRFDRKVKLDVLGDMIRDIRKQRKWTQEQLGKKVGVQKAQISKLEGGYANMTLSTLLKVVSALKADISFKIDAR